MFVWNQTNGRTNQSVRSFTVKLPFVFQPVNDVGNFQRKRVKNPALQNKSRFFTLLFYILFNPNYF